jgi:phosphoribosylglycinamide formyltransferase-1
MKARVVVCASGEGTGFESMVQASRQGELQAEIVGLITNRDAVGALQRAQRLQIPAQVITGKAYSNVPTWDRALAHQLQQWRADWVALAGFLALIGPEVLRSYPQRIVNSHPALLPKFGGPGMFGKHVHRAVVASGATESGVTIHLIDEQYDRGQILAQARVPVHPGDSPEALEQRVKASEVRFYPKVLNDLVTGRITLR